MDEETREEFAVTRAELRSEMQSTTKSLGSEIRSEMQAMGTELRSEMQTMTSELRSEMRAGFERIDGYFEKMQIQHLESQESINQRFFDVDVRFSRVDARLDSIDNALAGSRHEFQRFRDWSTVQFGELRTDVNRLTRRFEAMG